EIAWISAPLLISANVFLHACIRGMELVSIVILVSPALIKVYFYAAVYGIFECVAGIVALEKAMARGVESHRECPDLKGPHGGEEF
ncbi:hypothetical protein TELCIR_15891, partial [Teladorsagia circumcincta]